jgi:O-antigen polymerase
MVQWSPEPRVIEKLIESAVMMEAYDIALFHWRRYRVAYPQAYADWRARNEKLGELGKRL